MSKRALRKTRHLDVLQTCATCGVKMYGHAMRGHRMNEREECRADALAREAFDLGLVPIDETALPGSFPRIVLFTRAETALGLVQDRAINRFARRTSQAWVPFWVRVFVSAKGYRRDIHSFEGCIPYIAQHPTLAAQIESTYRLAGLQAAALLIPLLGAATFTAPETSCV